MSLLDTIQTLVAVAVAMNAWTTFQSIRFINRRIDRLVIRIEALEGMR